MLRDCAIETIPLAQMVRACRRLSIFKMDSSEVKIDAAQLMAALRDHAASLEILSIRTRRRLRPALERHEILTGLDGLHKISGLELDSDSLTGTESWPSCNIPALPPAMTALRVNTYSSLTELPWILSALATRLTPLMKILEVTFPLQKNDNAQYVESIKEADMDNEKWRIRPDRDWIILVSAFPVAGRFNIKFMCWNTDRSISTVIGGLVSRFNGISVGDLIEEFYSDWEIHEDSEIHMIRDTIEAIFSDD